MPNKVFASPYSVDVPAIDIPSYVFSSGTMASRESLQYFDAAMPSKSFSLAEAEVIVKRFALGLQTHGLKPGDRVLLSSKNQLFFPIVIWGIIAAGCIFTAASPTATVSELEYQIRDSGAKMVLAGADRLDVAVKAAVQSDLPRSMVYIFHNPSEGHIGSTGSSQISSWTKLWSTVEHGRRWSWKTITTIQEAKQTTAIINYSSGSTGLPKGVELSHYNLIANTEQVLLKRALVADTAAGRERRARLDASGERWLAVLPMYHAFGQTYIALTAPRLGAKVFIVSQFNLQQYLMYMDIYRITFMNAVPTIFGMISKQKNPERFNLKAVENVTNGSAPLDPEVGKLVGKRYLRQEIQVKQGWGMTETTCSVLGFAPDDVDDGRSIGWLHPNCLAKIVPVEGRDFSSTTSNGQATGEIWVAGPNIMKGYWQRPKETAEAFVNEDGQRWLRTGDIGYIDKRGCVYIVDRLKELIKVKGLQVAPAELEAFLATHPGVGDVAVVGAKVNGSEYPRAFVVRQNDHVTAEDLSQFIKQRFASHKWLTGGVYFIDAIPRTGSGKIIRRALTLPKEKVFAKL